MWSIRNYNAFIRAAQRTGGLSLPAARKSYRKMAARLNRPPKGTDVRNHPRIFRDSLLKRERTKLATAAVRKAGLAKRKVTEKRAISRNPEPTVERKRERVMRTLEEFDSLNVLTDFELGEIEYVTTAEYRK